MAEYPFPPMAQALVLLVCAALGAAHFVWGPTRPVKIGVALLVVGVAGGLTAYTGQADALGLVAVVLGVSVVAMSAAVLMHRLPIEKSLAPVDVSSCPRYGRKKLDEWTRGFESLGFSHRGDYESPWRFAGQTRRAFIRFLSHHSRTTWVEIHVLDEPKIAARLMASRTREGVYLPTVDRQANEEFFRDPQTHVVRVRSAATCAEMLRRHEDRAVEPNGSPIVVEDPPSLHLEIYNGWIGRLLRSRQLAASGSSARIPIGHVLGAVFRVMAAWFH